MHCKTLLLMFGLLLVAGCGSSSDSNTGGGNGSGNGDLTAPDAPVLSLAPQAIKTFQFTWEEVEGASEYRLLENPDGDSGYTQVAGIDGNATEHQLEVFLPERINAGYILEACNSAGCTSSSEVFVNSRLSDTVGYIKSTTNAEDQRFGASVALSSDGSTLAVWAARDDSGATGVDGGQNDDSAPRSGAVYVYVRNANGWAQQAYIKASNTDADDSFGNSLALTADGNTLAVGASREDSATSGIGGNQEDNSLTDSGAVYVFQRNDASVWSQEAYIKASNPGSTDRFGRSVALSGDGHRLAVGADWERSAATGIDGDQDDRSAKRSGAVYTFTRGDAGTWSQQSYIKASNARAYHMFGAAVSLSADGATLAVGAFGEDSGATGIDGGQDNSSVDNSGAVYVFVHDGTQWAQQTYIKASNTGEEDFLGQPKSVSLSGDGQTLSVGAIGEDSAATGIDGDQNDNSAEYSGAAYVFVRNGDTWSQQAYIKASNTDPEDYFGSAVALSSDGNHLLLGAYHESSPATGINGDQNDNSAQYSGAVYYFVRDGANWSQQAYIKAPNAEASDRFGFALALSAQADTLAVGALTEDGAATGIGGDQTDNSVPDNGAVYLY